MSSFCGWGLAVCVLSDSPHSYSSVVTQCRDTCSVLLVAFGAGVALCGRVTPGLLYCSSFSTHHQLSQSVTHTHTHTCAYYSTLPDYYGPSFLMPRKDWNQGFYSHPGLCLNRMAMYFANTCYVMQKYYAMIKFGEANYQVE